MDKVLYSSDKHDWETPDYLFSALDDIFDFTLDVCATEVNAKCDKYFSIDDDGLNQDWSNDVCWMNPPYGRSITDWVKKAYEESNRGSIVVGLVPARTDTRWFHDYVYNKADDILFLKGRVKFVGGDSCAPFPSMVVVWGSTIDSITRDNIVHHKEI